MKKLILLIVSVFSFVSIYSQSGDSLFSLNPETGEIYYSDVIKLVRKSKSDLFLSANSWFTDEFVSSQDVIQYSDKDKGVIIGKGLLQLKKGKVKLTIKISVKEGKYKYEFYDLIYKIDPGGIKTHGDLRQDKPGGGIYSMTRNAWKEERNRASGQIKSLKTSLIIEMSKTNSVNDDW